MDVHPFSFFNKIVISERTLSSRNLKMIIDHEYIHVKEKHTMDILFIEILFLLQWFNPLAWLLKDAVKNNLEYKTDDKIVRHHDPTSYQLVMVALADKKGVAPFLTALNGSQLKNRIIMMKKKSETRFKLVKQMVILPLLAILVMGLSNREVKTEIIQQQGVNYQFQAEVKEETFNFKGKTVGTISDNSGNFLINIDAITSKDIASIEVLKGTEAVEKYGDAAKDDAIEIAIKGGSPPNDKISSQIELRKYIAGKIKYPFEAQQAGFQGTFKVAVSFSRSGKVIAISKVEAISENNASADLELGMITVVSTKTNNEGPAPEISLDLMTNEIIRVVNELPEINIEEYKGKKVLITVKFVLQD